MNYQSSRKSKDEYERDLAGEYLNFKRLEFCRPSTLSEFCPDHESKGVAGPDIKAVIIKNDELRITVGIELTRYSYRMRDEQKKTEERLTENGSVSLRFRDIQDQLNDYVIKELYPSEPDLCSYAVRLTLKPDNLPTQRKIPDIAKEIVQVIRDLNGTVNNLNQANAARIQKSALQFTEGSMLKEYVRSLSVFRSRFPCHGWTVSDVVGIGVGEETIIETIDKKNEKLPKYDVRGCSEVWLLIAADGSGSDCRIGPPMERERILGNKKIVDAAQRSGFDKVIIWERAREWDAVISKAPS